MASKAQALSMSHCDGIPLGCSREHPGLSEEDASHLLPPSVAPRAGPPLNNGFALGTAGQLGYLRSQRAA